MSVSDDGRRAVVSGLDGVALIALDGTQRLAEAVPRADTSVVSSELEEQTSYEAPLIPAPPSGRWFPLWFTSPPTDLG